MCQIDMSNVIRTDSLQKEEEEEEEEEEEFYAARERSVIIYSERII